MNKIRTILIITALLIFTVYTNVYAGSVDVGFSGSDTVYVGDNIDLTVRVNGVNGLTNGLATLQADLTFDEGYLELVKSEDVSPSLSVSYGQKTKRFVALGMGGEYVSSNEDLLKLVFKAKTPGETTLNLSNTVVGDTGAVVHTANVSSKKVTILSEDSSSSAPTNSGSSTSSNSSNGSSKKSSSKTTGSSTSSSSNSSTLKSSDASLTKLMINNSKMSPSFNKNVTSYNVEVSSDVKKVSVDFITADSNAKAELIGNPVLADGVNILQVVVTAEDGTKKTYTLNITRSSEASSNKLILLNIAETKDLDFNEDKYEYNVKLTKDVKKLTIDAIPKSKGSKVEILGNKNLKTGKNVVLIRVTDKKGFTSYYRLNVNKDNKVKLFGFDILYWFIGLLILLFILILFIIIFKRKKKDDDEDIHKRITMHEDDVKKIKENQDIYDDIVTKEELIEAIEEKNSKKLKMLLTQEEANKLKDELREEEEENK